MMALLQQEQQVMVSVIFPNFISKSASSFGGSLTYLHIFLAHDKRTQVALQEQHGDSRLIEYVSIFPKLTTLQVEAESRPFYIPLQKIDIISLVENPKLERLVVDDTGYRQDSPIWIDFFIVGLLLL
jgi:hypothetical protein